MSLRLRRNNAWHEVPLPPPVSHGFVYHYTTAQGLLGITKDHELWASSALALNDLSEMTYGVEVVREAVASRGGSAGDFLHDALVDPALSAGQDAAYFLSASKNEDSLTQWIGYAGAQGYALGIDTAGPLALRSESDIAFDPETQTLGQFIAPAFYSLGWREVIYDRERQLEVVNDVLDFAEDLGLLSEGEDSVHIILLLAVLLPQFKHPAFKDECEVRFITGRIFNTTERHRAGRYGIVPYTLLIPGEAGTDGDTAVYTAKRLPLHSLTIGPASQTEHAVLSATAKRMLVANGYGQVVVAPSSIPNRF